VFERFTEPARRVLVLAQEEARILNHPFIGTEHLLLGLIHEDDGSAALALAQMDISLEAVREKVVEILGVFPAAPVGSPPFTPGRRRCLNYHYAKLSNSATTTSEPSTYFLESSARVRVSGYKF